MADDVSRDELAEAFNRAVDPQAGAEASGAEALDANAKGFFCDHWPMIKQVMKMLGDRIGGIGGIAVKGLIAAGDLMHQRTCG